MKKTDERLGEMEERGAEVGGSRGVVGVGPGGSPVCPFLLSAAQSWAGCLTAPCLSFLISRPHCAGRGPLPRQLHQADDTKPSAQGIRCRISPQSWRGCCGWSLAPCAALLGGVAWPGWLSRAWTSWHGRPLRLSPLSCARPPPPHTPGGQTPRDNDSGSASLDFPRRWATSQALPGLPSASCCFC